MRWLGKKSSLWSGTILILLIIVAYLPALRAGFIWDDDWHVTENRMLRSIEGLERIWLDPSRPGHMTTPQYYPMTHTTFWVEHHLWGNQPAGYHLDNVLLHAASAVVLWRLLAGLGMPGAWFAAGVWAVHPLNVESAAWATERKNVLSGLFYFLAAGAYLLAFAEENSKPKWGWYAGSFMLFLFALLSKTVASTLPAALLLVIWWKRGRVGWKDVARLGPFFVAGAVMGTMTSWMERNVVGAKGPEWAFSVADRILIAGRAVCFYAAKLFCPVALSFNYPRWTIDPHQWWQWLFPAIVVVTVAALFLLRNRIGRGALTGVLFFIGTLTPALGFFDVYPMRYSFVADHFQYIAGIGLIAVAVAAGRQAAGKELRLNVKAGMGIFLLTLATLTAARAEVFEGPETLWRDALAKNPKSWLAHMNLEKMYSAGGQPAIALGEIEQAEVIRPEDAKIHTRMAGDLAALGRLADARREYQRAMELDSTDAMVHYNYAEELAKWGSPVEAEAEYRKAIDVDPKTPLARNNLGLLLEKRGDRDGAMALYREELAVNPDSAAAATNLANAMVAKGNPSGAETVLQQLLARDSDAAKARNTLGIILAGKRDIAGAERELRRAIADDPNLAEAHNALGGVLSMQGRLDEAIREYREAIRLNPDFPQARRNLQATLAVRHSRQ